MEHGPSAMNAAVPEARAVSRRLGLDAFALDLGANVRRRYLLDRGRLHGIATHPLGFFASSYLSPRARLSMLAEIVRAPRAAGAPEETIHDFAARRFGAEFADKVMGPLAAGLFMGDARALSVDAAFPRLVAMERAHGSIARAVLAARRGGQPGRRMFSWPGGIATLPRRLAALLGARVRTGVAVTRIVRARGGFSVETAGAGAVRARALILAVQPHVAAQLLEGLDPDAAAAAGAIAAPPVAVVFFGWRRAQVAHPLDGLGFLGAGGAGRVVSGAQFCSTMFPGRAPKGRVAVACYVGGARAPEAARLPAPDLIALAQAEMADLLGVAGAPEVARVRHWPLGLPQYALGHAARREALESARQRVPGLFLTGNFLGGVSVADCLASARAVAERAEAVLSAHAPQQATAPPAPPPVAAPRADGPPGF